VAASVVSLIQWLIEGNGEKNIIYEGAQTMKERFMTHFCIAHSFLIPTIRIFEEIVSREKYCPPQQ
jgi:hypothetical protein